VKRSGRGRETTEMTEMEKKKTKKKKIDFRIKENIILMKIKVIF
jgi:predicted nucleic acid-binding protein